MQKILFFIALIIFLIIQTEPAFCGVSRTMSFQLSVTIPEHVIASSFAIAPVTNNTFQIIQTQTIIRNNKTISLTSIVVP